MSKKMRFIIAGIGGVGGYFGGLLAKRFDKSDEVEVCFLARGENLKRIEREGLKIIHKEQSYTVRPALVSDHANDLGIADYIIVCSKSYDLDEIIDQLRPCIKKTTCILPLLNGVNATEIIEKKLPGHTILGGCVYIISHLKEPGVIENAGNIQKLFFGLDNKTTDELLLLDKLFRQASIEATLSQSISSLVWEKFHLVGANSTATSYYDQTTGSILADGSKKEFILTLLKEVNSIALKKGISFEKEMVADTMEKLKNLPFETTSSMQRDFWKQNGKTELETITGYIVRAGKELNIETPAFEKAYEKLNKQLSVNLH
jgi:2-dehydropantoate 2-reductase